MSLHPALASTPAACPECHGALPPGSPQQLCPACLLRQALVSRTIPDAVQERTPLPPPSPEELADAFPAYEIAACLGRGGMGVVYRARQKSLDRWVALKILAPERVGQEKFAERFAREAQILARLNHPHIVAIHDHGQINGLFYIVMEFVDGVNLRDLLREGKLEPQQALAIVPPICEALQYAHDKGVVHRDIKPENLLLDREGRIKVADFGVAALVGAAAGERAGTPPYMAPEQTDAAAEVDHRADIYALGVVLYELLTGRRPEPGRLSRASAEMTPELTALVHRAIEREPAHRFATATELGETVSALARKPPRWRPGFLRALLYCGAASLTAVVLAALAALWLFLAGREPTAYDAIGHDRLWTTRRSVRDGRFVARLPNGSGVELLALRLQPNEDRAWWRPDGSPSDFDPAIEPMEEGDLKEGEWVQAIVRFTTPEVSPGPTKPEKAPVPFAASYPLRIAQVGGRQLPLADFGILKFRRNLDLKPPQTQPLSFAVETGEWKTLVAQKPGRFASLPFSVRGRDWSFTALPDGALKMVVPRLTEGGDFAYRLVALDRSGKEFRLRWSGAKQGDARWENWEAYYESPATPGDPVILLQDVAEVRWQARPREFLSFNYVSFRAGDLTEVEITDYSPPP